MEQKRLLTVPHDLETVETSKFHQQCHTVLAMTEKLMQISGMFSSMRRIRNDHYVMHLFRLLSTEECAGMTSHAGTSHKPLSSYHTHHRDRLLNHLPLEQ